MQNVLQKLSSLNVIFYANICLEYLQLDYVGFITKTMKLLQAGHNPEVRMIEMELSQLEESESAPQRPSKCIS